MAERSLQLMKGTVDLLILKTLDGGPRHGYAVSRWIREATNDVLSVEEGALYPALRRMERKGWLESAWGVTDTGRQAKFYELTPAGRGRLLAGESDWLRYVAAMASVFGPPAPGTAPQ